MKRLTVKEDVFKSAATFLVDATFDELKGFLSKYQHKDEPPLNEEDRLLNGFCLKTKNQAGERCFVVWVRKFDWTVRDMAVLSHEIIHLAVSILHDKGVPIRQENDEALAYLHEYYMVKTFWPLRKLGPAYKAKKKSKRAA